MLSALVRLASTPSPAPKVNSDLVTPGVVGFIVTFLIGVVTVLLILDMTRRIRRTRYRAEVSAKLDAEAAEAAQNEEEPQAPTGQEQSSEPTKSDHKPGPPNNHGLT